VRSFVTACLVWLLIASSAQAAYIGSPIAFGIVDQAQEPLGGQLPGLPNIPLSVQVAPSLAGAYQQGIQTKNGNIVIAPPSILAGSPNDKYGNARTASMLTDGKNYAGVNGANTRVDPERAALIVAPSPNPSLQCPFVAAVNQTASTTVVTNPGGAYLHICAEKFISATQQGITVAEGTGTACATGTTYLDGGSGGTNQVAVNGGWAATSERIVTPMQVFGDNLCVIQSGTGNVSGTITYGVYRP
jgi:hypothetical protein